MKLNQGKTIWHSTVFPGMIMTSLMLEVFRRAYPNIRKFKPQLEKAEAWLVSHPLRVPRKDWPHFINSWMRKANEIILEEKYRREDAIAIRRPVYKSEPKLIRDILREIANDGQQDIFTETVRRDGGSESIHE